MKGSDLIAAMESLLDIYHLSLRGSPGDNHTIKMNINHFMNNIFDNEHKRCECSVSEKKITVCQPYVIGSQKYQLSDKFNIIRSPEIDDAKYDQYEIEFKIDEDVPYVSDLIDDLKRTLGNTQFNLLEYKQTVTIKKENRGANSERKSLNEKNDHEVLSEVVKAIDEQIFDFQFEEILPALVAKQMSIDTPEDIQIDDTEEGTPTDDTGYMLDDFPTGAVLTQKLHKELTNKKIERADFVHKLKTNIEELFNQYAEQYEELYGLEDGKKQGQFYKEKIDRAFSLINKALKYITNRDEYDAILWKIEKTLKSSMAGKHKLEVRTQHYTFLSEPAHEIVVMPEQDFGEKVLQLRSDIRQAGDEFRIKRLSNTGWESFRDVIRSFFVEYALKYKNFNNIETCLNKDCQKIFVQNYSGKIFCSDACKKQFYKADHRTKCRQNQNRWIDKYKPNTEEKTEKDPYFRSIEINDCVDCEETVSRGHCPHIRNRKIGKDNTPAREKKILWKKEGGVWVKK
jgi:hypothetical protein